MDVRLLFLFERLMQCFMQEEVPVEGAASTYAIEAKGTELVQGQKKDSIIGKSLDKLKETSTV